MKPHLILVAVLAWAHSLIAGPLGNAFTYQGRLSVGNDAANGFYDFRFAVYDGAAGNGQIGAFYEIPAVPVTNGLFMATLDFGPGVFTGAERWLEVALRSNGGGAYVSLSPRQRLTATPYALYAPAAGTADSAATALAVAPKAVTTTALADATITAVKIATGQVVKSLNGLTDVLNLSAGANVSITPVGNGLQISALPGTVVTNAGWGLSGNAGTTTKNFLGTTDGQPLELRASNRRVLRMEASGGSFVNLIGGDPQNGVAEGVGGATIAGGGGWTLVPGIPTPTMVALPNYVAADFGTISGGQSNWVGGLAATLAGGEKNGIETGADFASLGGGESNFVRANAHHALVAGGLDNQVGPGAFLGVIGGGTHNRVNGAGATVPGGNGNEAKGYNSFAAGTQAHAAHDGAFVWTDLHYEDFASTSAHQFLVRAAGGVGINTNAPKAALHVAAPVATAYAGQFDGEVVVRVLTIIGGSDLAEPFEIVSPQVPAGAVVVIDEDHPGKLKLSDRSYDTRVAGVVSGANGIRPGLTLRQDGALEGNQHVALNGRVYVQAEAAGAPIKPGDLLTTSAVPGHAMKVTDHALAQGAILGKAMTGLKEGQGLVLVLVTLQ